MMQTFVMMVGELNYQNNFLDAYLNNELPFSGLTYLTFVIFVFMIPIVLVNLMVSYTTPPTPPPPNAAQRKHRAHVRVVFRLVDWLSGGRYRRSATKCCHEKNSHAGLFVRKETSP